MNAITYDWLAWISTGSKEILVPYFTQLLPDIGFNVVGYCEHNFQPHGFTSVWLLSESHLAIHAWPEHHKARINLSSCSLELFDAFVARLKSDKTLPYNVVVDGWSRPARDPNINLGSINE